MEAHELRAARVTLGLKQSELAKALGLTSQYISIMERGAKTIEIRTELAVRYLLLAQPRHFVPESAVDYDSETWRDVVGYEGLYEISSHGRVHKHARVGSPDDRLIKPHVGSDGYYYVNLRRPGDTGISRAVHILVARAFLGEPEPGYEVSHEDGDRKNPRLDNLKYRTRKDNLSLTERHGTKLLGENTNFAVLTKDQVREIKRRGFVPRDPVLGDAAIGREYGVTTETIRQIRLGNTWAHVTI